MLTLRKYLKHLYPNDLYFALIGGLIGSLLGAFFFNFSLYKVGIIALLGMIFSAYIVARKRMSSKDM